ncbi:MAG: hypothetical protein M1825_002371 [Sarcosagium campestre]|nr:MAG: hypothetical protein M1825_002371 [Sarcosagium campestre]
MICKWCLQRANAGFISGRSLRLFNETIPVPYSVLPRSRREHFSSTTSRPSEVVPSTATITQAKPRQSASASSPAGPPSATSTSAAQPFSTPLTPSPHAEGVIVATKTREGRRLPKSTVAAGTTLKGINYFKNKPDPIALEDSEYPDWLWTCLESKAGDEKAKEGEMGDLFAKSKKQRRVAAKRLRKEALADTEPKAVAVPVQQQSINLPGNESGTVLGAVEALKAREELTTALRRDRRSKIKENNFLRGLN